MATAAQIIDALFRAGRGVQTYRELPEGLRRTHLYVLHALEQLGGTARVTDIAAQSLVKVPNMTRLLKETDAAGWTERTTVPTDLRTVLVHLTRSGAECLKTYYWDYLEAIAEHLRPEDHPEYDVMITAIDQALTAITQATDAVNDTRGGLETARARAGGATRPASCPDDRGEAMVTTARTPSHKERPAGQRQRRTNNGAPGGS